MSEMIESGSGVKVNYNEVEDIIKSIEIQIRHLQEMKKSLSSSLNDIDNMEISGQYLASNQKLSIAIEKYYDECIRYYKAQLQILRNICNAYNKIDSSMSKEIRG